MFSQELHDDLINKIESTTWLGWASCKESTLSWNGRHFEIILKNYGMVEHFLVEELTVRETHIQRLSWVQYQNTSDLLMELNVQSCRWWQTRLRSKLFLNKRYSNLQSPEKHNGKATNQTLWQNIQHKELQELLRMSWFKLKLDQYIQHKKQIRMI